MASALNKDAIRSRLQTVREFIDHPRSAAAKQAATRARASTGGLYALDSEDVLSYTLTTNDIIFTVPGEHKKLPKRQVGQVAIGWDLRFVGDMPTNPGLNLIYLKPQVPETGTALRDQHHPRIFIGIGQSSLK